MECGDVKPSQGPLEPGSLRAELCLGGQGTAEGALLLSRFSRVQLCATPELAAHQAPLSIQDSKTSQW